MAAYYKKKKVKMGTLTDGGYNIEADFVEQIQHAGTARLTEPPLTTDNADMI